MAKIVDYTHPATGASFLGSYWNTKFFPINVRSGQESLVFWFDGFVSRAARDSDKAIVDAVSVTVPMASIPAYLVSHLRDRKTLPELAYQALVEFGPDQGLAWLVAGTDDTDPTAQV